MGYDPWMKPIGLAMPPNTIKLFDVVTIHADGRVEIKDGVPMDAAAEAFWRAVRDLAPQFFKQTAE